jgi:transposase
VFVRPISDEEGQRLLRITRRSSDRVRLRRAMVVLASAQGQSVPVIAGLTQTSQKYVREVIAAFNSEGFAALDPKWSGGRTATHDRAVRRRIVAVALSRPTDLGQPFSVWSLSKLAGYLVAVGVVGSVSRETLRRILHAEGVSWQRTKTWKTSTDPDYEAKKTRVLDLYDRPPVDGRVICVDEFGPLNLQPRPGRGWRPVGRPARQRATYRRTDGVRHLFGALDLATGKIAWRIRDRKRWQEFLAFCKQLRRRWPGQKLYLVVDNFSPHLKTEVRGWCAANDVDLVFTPTNASWLNWIECEFAALRYFALNGTDHRSHAEQDTAVGDYIRWRNRHATPKRDFAPNSKIRDQLPGYRTNVA